MPLPPFPGREVRPEQDAVIAAIQEAFATPCHALIEAGTGVGKTLGYLTPAIPLLNEGKRVIVATYTKALQSQIWEKDIPLLQSLYPNADLRPALLKGRSNYLCKADMDALAKEAALLYDGDAEWQALETFSHTTGDGDLSRLPGKNRFVSDIAARKETCRGSLCPYFGSCWHLTAVEKARSANLLVVNHALYLADSLLAEEGERLLPDHHAVVFDEAHHLEEAATGAYSTTLNSTDLRRLLQRVRSWRLKWIEEDLFHLADALAQAFFAPFALMEKDTAYLAEALDGATHDRTLRIGHQLIQTLTLAAVNLHTSAARLGVKDEEEKPTSRDLTLGTLCKGAGRLAETFAEQLAAFLREAQEDSIRYAERKKESVTLTIAPVDVASLLKRRVWSQTESAILVSATLAAHDGFQSVRSRVGLADAACKEVVVGSSFNYETNCRLYIPAHLPAPRSGEDRPAEQETFRRLADEIRGVLRLTQGRAFLLFTSWRVLKGVTALLSDLPYPLLQQGDASPHELVERFKTEGNAVLAGVASFWQGVDVPGDALSVVVMDRLPFSQPDLPLHRARVARIEEAGGDWFMEYALPDAITRLKQGFGRLLRSKEDKGAVVILDTRLLTRRYGRLILSSLPPAPVVTDRTGFERGWNALQSSTYPA